jgi:ribosomal protein S27E
MAKYKCHHCGTIDGCNEHDGGRGKLVCERVVNRTKPDTYFIYCRSCFYINFYHLELFGNLKFKNVFNGKDALQNKYSYFVFGYENNITRAMIDDGIARAMEDGSLRSLEEKAPLKKSTPIDGKVIIKCPSCNGSLRVTKDKYGNIRCPICNNLFEVVSPNLEVVSANFEEVAQPVNTNFDPPKTTIYPSRMFHKVKCPNCGNRVEITSPEHGVAKCPSCNELIGQVTKDETVSRRGPSGASATSGSVFSSDAVSSEKTRKTDPSRPPILEEPSPYIPPNRLASFMDRVREWALIIMLVALMSYCAIALDGGGDPTPFYYRGAPCC